MWMPLAYYTNAGLRFEGRTPYFWYEEKINLIVSLARYARFY